MPNAKIKPSDLRCGRPYTLTAKGKLLFSEQDRTEVRDFIEVYRKSGHLLLELFLDWWRQGGDTQIAAVLLIFPARVSPRIEDSPLWKKTHAEAEQVIGRGWHALINLRLYHFLRTMAGIEGRAASGPKMMAEFLARVAFPPLAAERFAAIFEPFPTENLRWKLTSQVAGILRGFFSQAENARRENETKARILTDLRAANPGFYCALEGLLRSQAAWQRVCRSLMAVRRRLIDQEQIPIAIVNACQIQAIRERADMVSWQAAVDIHSPAALDAILQRAVENRRVVDEILRAFPESPAPDGLEEAMIRRFVSGKRVRDIARDPYLARRLLELYDQHVEAFPADKREVLGRVERLGRKAIHTGWREVINSKGSQPFVRAKSFFFRELVNFASALRPLRTPALVAERVTIWPMFDERKQWRIEKKQPAGIGNAVALALKLPAFLARPERSIPVTLRGNVPFTRAQALSEPVDVLDGVFQFRPSEVLRVAGDPSRKSYVKLQGLRVTSQEDDFFAIIAMRRMTESIGPLSAKLSNVTEFGPGERIAIFHLCPGGMRLGTLTLFEHRDRSWKIVRIHEVVARSDEGAYQQRGAQSVRVRNRGAKLTTHLHFDMNTLSVALDTQMDKLSAGPAGKISVTANRTAVAEVTPVKATLAEAWLRRAAHRIELLLAGNQVSRLIVAGRGQISTRSGVPVPVRRFFALEAAGPRKNAVGYLAYAAQKAGVTLHTISGRFSLIDSKGFPLASGVTLAAGLPYRFLRRDETGFEPKKATRTQQGIPQHLYLSGTPERLVDFYRNGAESILWAWIDKDFRANALSVLKRANAQPVELPL